MHKTQIDFVLDVFDLSAKSGYLTRQHIDGIQRLLQSRVQTVHVILVHGHNHVQNLKFQKIRVVPM